MQAIPKTIPIGQIAKLLDTDINTLNVWKVHSGIFKEHLKTDNGKYDERQVMIFSMMWWLIHAECYKTEGAVRIMSQQHIKQRLLKDSTDNFSDWLRQGTVKENIKRLR